VLNSTSALIQFIVAVAGKPAAARLKFVRARVSVVLAFQLKALMADVSV